MKKIVCLLGSPRINGNSATVAGRFLETAQSLGAETETFVLNRCDFRGCQACWSCKTQSVRCAVNDDLTPVLDAVARTDILLLASPVYFGDVSSQMKAFIDRTYSFLKPDFLNESVPSRLAPGKQLVFVLSQAQPENMFVDIYPKYEFFYQMMGFQNNRLIRACQVGEAGEVNERSDVLEQAESAARQMLT